MPDTSNPRVPDPPHGGSWLRLKDGSLELLQSTQPTLGRVPRDTAPPPAAPAVAPTDSIDQE